MINEVVTLNCTYDQYGNTLTHTCGSGQVLSLACDGTYDSKTFTCSYMNTSTCGIWDGTKWDDSSCEIVSVGLYQTACKCYDVTGVGLGASSSKEFFMDVASVATMVMNDVIATFQVATLLSTTNIARNFVVFITIGVILQLAVFMCYFGYRQDVKDEQKSKAAGEEDEDEVLYVTGAGSGGQILTKSSSKKKLAAMAASKADRLTELVNKSLPDWARAKNIYDLVTREMAKRHDYFSVVFVYSKIYSRPFRVAIICTTTLLLMFTNAVLYVLAYPTDTCSSFANDKHGCLSQTYSYNSGKSMCRFIKSSPSQCVFIEPDGNSYMMTVIIAVVSNMIVLPLNQLIALIFDKLVLPPLKTSHLVIAERREQEKLQKQQTFDPATMMTSTGNGMEDAWKRKTGSMRKIMSEISREYSKENFGTPALDSSSTPSPLSSPKANVTMAIAEDVDGDNNKKRKAETKVSSAKDRLGFFNSSTRALNKNDLAAAALYGDDEQGQDDIIIPATRWDRWVACLTCQSCCGGSKVEDQLETFKQQKLFAHFLDLEVYKTITRVQEQRKELVDHIALLEETMTGISDEVNRHDLLPEAKKRYRAQHDFLRHRILPLKEFLLAFEKKWHLDHRTGKPRKSTYWETMRGYNFYEDLRKKIKKEIETAAKLEKTLLELDPKSREIRLLEYQRLDFLSEVERQIYLRNQVCRNVNTHQ